MGSIAAKHWKRWRLNAGGGTFLADVGTSSTLSGVTGGASSFTKNGPGTADVDGQQHLQRRDDGECWRVNGGV
jgi:hypothetical protein